jgi:hypothetical protein
MISVAGYLRLISLLLPPSPGFLHLVFAPAFFTLLENYVSFLEVAPFIDHCLIANFHPNANCHPSGNGESSTTK